jgi:GT2 family glycosyltransferase
MLFDLNKFLKKKIFDENFFLFYEETDLCRRIMKKNGIIYSSSDLIIDHLGEKSSFAAIPELKVDYVKLRNWHLLWSSFYYEKKHFGYFFSFKKHLFSLVKDAMKIIFYIILFNKEKYLKHLYRFSGLISSMIGKKSNFRIY